MGWNSTFGLVLTMALASGCGTTYSSGSFRGGHGEAPQARATRGCLDLALDSYESPHTGGPVLEVFVGNRCAQKVAVDFRRLFARDGSTGVRKEIQDPRSEIRAAVVGGRLWFRETFAVDATGSQVLCARFEEGFGGARSPLPVTELCTDVRASQ